MTPEELAKRHPFLFHTTHPENWEGILQYGLFSTKSILELHEWENSDRVSYIRQRRPESDWLRHDSKGVAVITDNSPLHEGKLARCLDDGLTPADWLAMLNSRVFFWTNDKNLARLMNANASLGQERLVLTFDTLKLARAYSTTVEICPFNSGSTIHQPAQRGLSTFSRISEIDFAKWRRSRKKSKLDNIKEVTIQDRVLNVTDYLTCAVTIKNGVVVQRLWPIESTEG